MGYVLLHVATTSSTQVLKMMRTDSTSLVAHSTATQPLSSSHSSKCGKDSPKIKEQVQKKLPESIHTLVQQIAARRRYEMPEEHNNA